MSLERLIKITEKRVKELEEQCIIVTPKGLYKIVSSYPLGSGTMVCVKESDEEGNTYNDAKLFHVYNSNKDNKEYTILAFGDYAWLKPYLKKFLEKQK